MLDENFLKINAEAIYKISKFVSVIQNAFFINLKAVDRNSLKDEGIIVLCDFERVEILNLLIYWRLV